MKDLCAETRNQMNASNSGPPQTREVQFIVFGVRSFPRTAGKHRIGTIKATNPTCVIIVTP